MTKDDYLELAYFLEGYPSNYDAKKWAAGCRIISFNMTDQQPKPIPPSPDELATMDQVADELRLSLQ